MALPRGNKLIYPAGIQARYNPSHVASQGLIGCCVPSGANGINIAGAAGFQKNQAVAPSLATAGRDAVLGPVIQFSNPAGSGCQFNRAVLAASPTNGGYTFAGFVRLAANGSATYDPILSTSDTNNGNTLLFGRFSGAFAMRWSGTATFSSGVTPTNGVPYFYATSLIYRGSNLFDHYHVIKRMDTGQVTAVTVTGTNPGVGALQSFTFTAFDYGTIDDLTTVSGALGPAMFSIVPLTLQQLVGFADDPWGFWYPQSFGQIKGTVAAGGFIPAWALGSNLPVVGTGIF